jgi:hypothetical protein
VAAGVYDAVLATSVEKLEDSGLQGLPESMIRPVLRISGLRMNTEAYKQLQAKGGKKQIKNSTIFPGRT